MKKPVKIALTALLLVALAAYAAYGMLSPLTLAVEAVERADLCYQFKEEGIVAASESLYLSARSAGEVAELLCGEGEQIAAGQTLFTLSVPDLETQLSQLLHSRSAAVATGAADRRTKELELLQLRAQLRDATMEEELNYSQWQDGTDYSYVVEKAVRDLKEAHYAYEKAYDEGLEGDDLQYYLFDIVDANVALEIARRRYQGDYKQYIETLKVSLSAQIELLEAELDYGALSPQYAASVGEIDASIARVKELIADSSIKAPMDGIITWLPVSRGQSVQPGTTLAALSSTEEPRIEVYLLAENSVHIAPGDAVRLSVPASGETGSGRVVSVSPAAVEIVSSIGLTERRVKVTVVPDVLPRGYGLGFALDVTFEPLAAAEALSLPAGAVISGSEGYGVYVVENARAVLRPVTVGVKAGGRVQITGGLEAGEQVVLDPRAEGLTEGARVQASVF